LDQKHRKAADTPEPGAGPAFFDLNSCRKGDEDMRHKGEKRKITKKIDSAPVETVQKKLQRNTKELSEEEAREVAQTAERLNDHPEDEAAVRMNDEGGPQDVEMVGEGPADESGASDLPEDTGDDQSKKRHPLRRAS